MNLEESRRQIDEIDRDILKLFEKRMAYAEQVAQYKQKHHLPIFQKDREQAILKRVQSAASPQYADGALLLFQNLMEISKCSQQAAAKSSFSEELLGEAKQESDLPDCPKVGYFGMEGSFTSTAAFSQFCESRCQSFSTFSEVFDAVEAGLVDLGVLPIDNSSAGSVDQVYQLLRSYPLFINRMIQLKIEHCLAAKPGVPQKKIKRVYSHSQALTQCKNHLEEAGLLCISSPSTAEAARFVSESREPLAAICSESTARRYGLQVLQKDMQDACENYTRFIVISRHLYLRKQDNVIAISLALPHETGALYRLLAKFSIHRVNLTKIESQPIGTKHFDVVFYLDFSGNLADQTTRFLLNSLQDEVDQFRFLGCYRGV